MPSVAFEHDRAQKRLRGKPNEVRTAELALLTRFSVHAYRSVLHPTPSVLNAAPFCIRFLSTPSSCIRLVCTQLLFQVLAAGTVRPRMLHQHCIDAHKRIKCVLDRRLFICLQKGV